MSVGVESPRRRNRRRAEIRKAKRRARVAVVVSLAVLLGTVAGVYLLARSFLGLGGGGGGSGDDYAGPGRDAVVVVVERGDTASQIGRTLQKAGVVKTAKAFVAAARAEPDAEKIQPGSYQLRREMRASEALALLLSPEARVQARVTVREGLRLDETLKLLSERTGVPVAEFQQVLLAPASIGLPADAQRNAEGFLFPATYDFPPDADAKAILTMMTERFAEAAEQAGLKATSGYTVRQIVIIASIVEAEARHDEDFGKVARVVHNRLQGKGDTGGRLEMDSTVNYILRADKVILNKKDLDADSPYNTRKYAGLPPGPINSPGVRALQAAMAPPPGDWVYFVTVDRSGLTKFTGDYDQFLKWKAEARRNGVA
jgi:UPF0755 protein